MRTILVAALLALVTGCSGGGTKSDPCGFEHRGVGATAQYHHDPTCATNPFPSDALVSAGTLTLPTERFTWTLPRSSAFDQARAYVTTVASSYDADGFSTIAPIVISVDYPVDPATAADGVALFRFTGTTPAPDPTVLVATYDSNLSSLVLQPQTPLAPATMYGVVVDADLLSQASGAPTTRSRQFGEALAEAGPELAALVAAGGPSDRIALAFTFTTQSIHEPLYAVRDRIFGVLGSALAPSFADAFTGVYEGTFANGSPEFTATMVDANVTVTSNIGFMVNGTFETYDFRGPDGRGWDDALVNGTSAPPTETIIFRMTLPPGTPPAGGWPLVIFGHGLGGNESDVYEQGQHLSSLGFAVAGVSAIEHGRRGDVISFFDWDSIPGTRESFRQTTADQLQLLRTLQNGQGLGMAPFTDLNLDDVTYYGISLGGILGSGFVATAPGVDRGLLIVPGGHLSLELYAQAVGVNYLWPYIGSRSGIDYLTQQEEWNDFLGGFTQLVQIGLDPGDPVNWAPMIDTGVTPILMLESEGDNWVPNDTNEALRRALGIPLLTQATTDVAGVSGTWLYRLVDFPEHTELSTREPHGWYSTPEFCEARTQAFRWLETRGQEVLDPTQITCP